MGRWEAAPLTDTQPTSPDTAEEAPAQSDLRLRLAQMEGQLLALQQQLTHLATCLLQRNDLPGPVSAVALSSAVPSAGGQATREPISEATALLISPSARHRPHPAERRRRPILPLIEYGAQGRYVLICPQEGELSIVPDSSEWFAWLASLTSFRFVGKAGRFSAHREYDQGPRRSWSARRVIHQHLYKHYLGTTDHLTMACLEQMAANLQSYVE